MSFFEQARYYFNDVLPDIVVSNLVHIDNILYSYWFVFFIISIVFFIIIMRLVKKTNYNEIKNKNYDRFLQELSLKTKKQDVEKKLIQSVTLSKASFIAIYELRGGTYLLIESNTIESADVDAPLRIGIKELNSFKKSGKYSVVNIVNSSKNYMMLLFSLHALEIETYYGNFDIMLSYYEQIADKYKAESGKNRSIMIKNTSESLMKLQMDKNQFFKFIIAIVVKITKAEDTKLLTKDNDVVFEYESGRKSILQKLFYIRNTPYKMELYNSDKLTKESIVQVGSFLDMAASFLTNIDQNSKMVQNYLSFLKFTNEVIEMENKYYKGHSSIVQTVSYELAKSLFLSEDEIDIISLGAYLHDIGMIGDLLTVINKDKFEEKDMNLIKEHPLIGSIIVEPICHIYPIANIIRYHHERFDGKGYPFGLKGSDIPIDAQVVAVGEFYAGITGDRFYKKGKTHKEAVEEIKKVKGKMFSNVLVDAFLDIENSIEIKVEKIKMKKDKNNEI